MMMMMIMIMIMIPSIANKFWISYSFLKELTKNPMMMMMMILIIIIIMY
jgi:hypothetical protein